MGQLSHRFSYDLIGCLLALCCRIQNRSTRSDRIEKSRLETLPDAMLFTKRQRERYAMKRRVGGILLAILGLIVTLAGSSQGKSDTTVTGLFMLAGATMLIVFGQLHLNRKKRATEMAFDMIREKGLISALDLAHQMGISEVDIRGYLMDAKHKKLIAPEIEIF
jgi:hypothetical protein